jgi:hypothetical protein
MKTKILGIFVCTLLITTGTIAVADWDIDDGHKMHWPQLPDPNGWDVDFHDYLLGDDWKCSESGPITDIHFWISWFDDMVLDIPWIKVFIYSNNPEPPSSPAELLWSRTFDIDQFIIAGPWNGDQGWLWPYGEYIEHNHFLYWQINIPEIDDPWHQVEGEIYWLVIGMPYFDPPTAVGWKTSQDHFEDAAVWGGEGNWEPIYDPLTGDNIDFAFVITGEEPCDPSIDIEKYVWDEENSDWIDADTMSEALDIAICEDATFKIVVTNTGDCPLYHVNISDHMHESLKYTNADPEPDDVWYNDTNKEWRMYWFIPGPIDVGEAKEITVIAHVEGPECSTDYNWVHVGAVCEHGIYVEDEDECWVHAFKKSREINRPFLQFLQTHPKIFLILRLLLQRFGLQ